MNKKYLINKITEISAIGFISLPLIIFPVSEHLKLIPPYIVSISYHILFLIILFVWLLKGLIYKGNEFFQKTCFDIPLIFLIIACVISTLFSVYTRWSIEHLFTTLAYIIFFLFVVNNFNSYTQFQKLLLAILLPLIIISITGIAKFIANFEVSDFIKSPLSYRAGGLYTGCPTESACFLGIGIPITLGFILQHTSRLIKLFFFIYFIILLTALIFTFSLAGYLQTFVSILLLLVLTKRVVILKFQFLVLLLFFLVILFFARIVFLPEEFKISSSGRLFMWNVTTHLIKDKILTGFGLGNFSFVYPWYHIEFPHHKDYLMTLNTAHNSFLQLISEGGLIYLFALLWILILFFTHLVRLYKSKSVFPDKEISGYISSCVICGFLVNVLFHHYFGRLYPIGECYNIIFWCLLAIFTSYVNMNKSSHKWYNKRSTLVIIPILIIIYSFLMIKSNTGKFFYYKATQLEEKNETIAAINEYKKSINIDPTLDLYYIELGECYYNMYYVTQSKKLKKLYLEKSLEKYKKAAELNPYFILSSERVLILSAFLGKRELASEYFNKMEKFLPYLVYK